MLWGKHYAWRASGNSTPPSRPGMQSLEQRHLEAVRGIDIGMPTVIFLYCPWNSHEVYRQYSFIGSLNNVHQICSRYYIACHNLSMLVHELFIIIWVHEIVSICAIPNPPSFSRLSDQIIMRRPAPAVLITEQVWYICCDLKGRRWSDR